MKKVLIEFCDANDSTSSERFRVLKSWNIINGNLDLSFNYSQISLRQVLIISVSAPILLDFNYTKCSEQEIFEILDKNLKELSFTTRLRIIKKEKKYIDVRIDYEERENCFMTLTHQIKYNGKKYKQTSLSTCQQPKKKKKLFTI